MRIIHFASKMNFEEVRGVAGEDASDFGEPESAGKMRDHRHHHHHISVGEGDEEGEEDEFELPFEYSPHPLVVSCTSSSSSLHPSLFSHDHILVCPSIWFSVTFFTRHLTYAHTSNL